LDTGKSYKELEDSLLDLPVTWYPALIKIMVRESTEKKCWVRHGCSNFVKIVEDEYYTEKGG